MFAAKDLAAALQRLLPRGCAPRYCVAFSGGVDSSALLHALVQLRGTPACLGVRAVHVNHHLQPNADAWAAHAAQVAATLGVELEVRDARIAAKQGQSLEAVARNRRYRLLAEALQDGEILLTAHHRDDQLETFLLQLARGAGVAGLAAMPARARFAKTWHLRPLLEITRTALEDYVGRSGLTWVEDTSNSDLRFDRNFLREKVLPALRERWPGISANVARSAAHMAEARELLDEMAHDDLADSRAGRTLQCAPLRAIGPAHARNAVRYWLREQGFTVPSTARLDQIVKGMLHARPDASPVVRWPGVEVRRYRDRLYAMKPLPRARKDGLTWDWRTQPKLDLGEGLGTLSIAKRRSGLHLHEPPCPLRVEWRLAGARFTPQSGRPSRSLRYVFQEDGIVPWMRGRIPLLISGKRLVAVGDLHADVAFQGESGEAGTTLVWTRSRELV